MKIFILAKKKFQEQLLKFVKRFENMKAAEYLESTFLSTTDDSPFVKSGIIPYKLVAVNMWITK